MENQEALIILAAAREEIRCLRRDNQLMAARLDVFDTMRAILHASPYPERPMGVDVVWEIEKMMTALQPHPTATPPVED